MNTTTLAWPQKIKPVFEQNTEIVEDCKAKFEESLQEKSENITKELSDLETLIYEIKERTSDHKEMQRGTYKEDKDFVPMYNGMLIVNTLYDSYSFSFQISRRSSRGSPRSPPSPLFCLVTMIIAT